jgi:hypothetical protein
MWLAEWVATSWPLLGRSHGVVLSPVKLWVLAMLAPKRGLCVAPVPPQAANLTGLVRDRRYDGRSGRRNRRCDRTKEQRSASITSLPGGSFAAYSRAPIGG